jgi:two-component system, LytTR family, sensor kinase
VIVGVLRVTLLVAIAFGVHRLTRVLPWPTRPPRWRFVLIHVAMVPVCVVIFLLASKALTLLLLGYHTPPRHVSGFFVVGGYLYVVVAGASYMVEATRRTARAETAAAQMQLAALRAQIHPHFLFNALHTVVQLIPINPARAMEAAELVADLLRATMEDDRDVISLREQWAFVSRYLELERIRFGERLRVHADVDPDLLEARIPSFALQTLVENAVRHGAAPRIEPTDIVVTAAGTHSEVTLSVRNNGGPAATNGSASSTGTGLNRLRERLVALHGNAARLTYGARDDGGFEAVVMVPRESGTD